MMDFYPKHSRGYKGTELPFCALPGDMKVALIQRVAVVDRRHFRRRNCCFCPLLAHTDPPPCLAEPEALVGHVRIFCFLSFDPTYS